MSRPNDDAALLPWGHWLRMKPGEEEMILIDEAGREWSSVREAFFHGRLGFNDTLRNFREVELERMLVYLLGASGPFGISGMPSRGDDLFQDHAFSSFYRHWLGAHGLMEKDPRSQTQDAMITAQGRSVAKMLLATRRPGLAGLHPGVETVIFAGGRVEEVDRTDFERGDHGVAEMQYAFVRERIGRQFTISLVHRDVSLRMPLVRTIWTQTFADERSRDVYHVWMSDRPERWNAWGDIAFRGGAGALTRHLLSLLAGEMADRSDRASGCPPVCADPQGGCEAAPPLAIKWSGP